MKVIIGLAVMAFTIAVASAQAATDLTDAQLDRVTAGYVPPGGDGTAPGVLGVQVWEPLHKCDPANCFPIFVGGKIGDSYQMQIQLLLTTSGVH
jgi:hypothetical protein